LAEQKELDEEIRHVLTEIRMVLPGAQALLGFQFMVMVLQEFETLPNALKQTHLVSLSLMTFAVILLMTPAAYHRIVVKGENTREFHQFAGRMLLASLIPLALGGCERLLHRGLESARVLCFGILDHRRTADIQFRPLVWLAGL
jgi:hypothetical protein